MVNAVSDYYKLECEIRKLNKEIAEITASCDIWCKDALKYKKQIVYLKELNNGLNYQMGIDND